LSGVAHIEGALDANVVIGKAVANTVSTSLDASSLIGVMRERM
jgi:hypothetical protein